jgi:hypothetical protein
MDAVCRLSVGTAGTPTTPTISFSYAMKPGCGFTPLTLLLCACSNSTFQVPTPAAPPSSVDEDFTLGNIPSFLGHDPYYPFTAIGSRYSSALRDSVQSNTNCLKFAPPSGPIDIPVDLIPALATIEDGASIDDIIKALPEFRLFLLQSPTSGGPLVRGPKRGIKCERTDDTSSPTSPTLKSPTEVCTVLRDLVRQFDARQVGAGTVETFIPEILSKRTECIDMEAVFAANQTLYRNLGPDPRNPEDPTRNQGLFPQCSAKTCFADRYIGKMSGNTFYLHDQLFRAHRMIELAKVMLPTCAW